MVWKPRRDGTGSADSSWFVLLSLPLPHFSLDSEIFVCHTLAVPEETTIVQGRAVTETDLEQIGQLIASHPEWSRWRLSRALATGWNSSNAGACGCQLAVAFPPTACAPAGSHLSSGIPGRWLGRLRNWGLCRCTRSAAISKGGRFWPRLWPSFTIWATAAAWAKMRNTW